MKKIIYLFAILLLGITTQAQFINYQGVARDNAGNILINQPIALRLSVLSGSALGTAVYVETHATTTDGYGLFTLQIGQGTVVSGVFNDIAWSSTSFFLKVEIDPTGGTNYGLAGTTQFAAVPYAFNAKNGNPTGQNPGDMLYWNGTAWVRIPASTSNGLTLTFCNGAPRWGPCIDFATIFTTEVTSISVTGAISGGNVTNNGGSAITARGICLSTNINPDLNDNTFPSGSGSGSFTTNLTGLNPNTTYHIRAYATNSAGTIYGNEITFTTLLNPVLPSLTTTTVSNISYITAISGGNVTFDGGATVTARGICWDTTANPTITGSHTTIGVGTGIFTSSIIGLIPNTKYYARAFATNSAGTAYGNEVIFITLTVVAPQVPREMVVVEIASGTWNQYDIGAAMGANDLIANGHNCAVIRNHNGDIFSYPGSDSRNTYYGVTGYPTAKFDGVETVVGGSSSSSKYSNYAPLVNQRNTVLSSFHMDIAVSNVGNDYSIILNINKVAEYSGTNLVVYLVLTETEIPFSWQGQTHCNFVNRQMIPTQNGTPVSFSSGSLQVLNIMFAKDPTWITEHCEVVAFIQDTATKEILQGKKIALSNLAP
jgi:hypothetical protein